MQSAHLQRSAIHYGWFVVAASVAVMMFTIGLLIAFGVFLKPIHQEFNWSRTSVALASTLSFFSFGICSFISGALADRFGTRIIVLVGGILAGAGILLSAFIRTPLQLYLSFGILAGFGIGAFYVPLTSLVTHWFNKRRGVAVGIVSSGSGIGILVISPLARAFISAYGWRVTFLLLGGLTWVVVLSACLVLRNRPRDVGLEPYGGDDPQESLPSPAASPESRRWTRSEVIKHPMFWGIGATHFFCCLAHSGPLFHLVAMATDVGISKMIAASFVGITGFTSIIARIVTGAIADRYGLRTTLILCLALQTIIVVSFRFATNIPGFISLTVFLGFAFGGVMPLYVLVSREFFGFQIVGTVYGFVFMLSSIGMGFGSFFGGVIFDYFGAYTWLFFLSGAFGALSVLAAASLRPPGKPREPIDVKIPATA